MLSIFQISGSDVGITESGGGPKRPKRIRAAGKRMFDPVAIVTRSELEDLISQARHDPDGTVHALEDLYREFFE